MYRTAVLESLRHIPHAPSVQMQPIPNDTYASSEEDSDNDEAPGVKNKDVRITRRMREAYRVPEGALSDSEDEDVVLRKDRHSFKERAVGGRKRTGPLLSEGRDRERAKSTDVVASAASTAPDASVGVEAGGVLNANGNGVVVTEEEEREIQQLMETDN
jgi:hypothetical protein